MQTPRPDYVICIAENDRVHPEHERQAKSLCGRVIGGYGPVRTDGEFPLRELVAHEFVFTGPTHAYHNAKQEGRLLTCPECARVLIETIQKHTHEGL